MSGSHVGTNGAGHTVNEWQSGDLCKWRYRGVKRWQRSHVLGVLSDKDGSVKVWNQKTGFPAYVPDVPECILRRKR